MINNFIFTNINMALQQHPIYYLENDQYKIIGAAFLGDLGETIIHFSQELNTKNVVLGGDIHACHLIKNIINNIDDGINVDIKGEE